MLWTGPQPRASVTNVEIVGGDAHVICVSNKIKHLFEFNVKIKFTLSIEMVGVNPQSEVRSLTLSAWHSLGSIYRARGLRTLRVYPGFDFVARLTRCHTP